MLQMDFYAIDSTRHSPLIGFAYDGFPIYGAYGYLNEDGTGGVVRIKSSFKLRNITERTTYADGSTVSSGPAISQYPLGYFREDYEYDATLAAASDYLDEHNGRFCSTPEYPEGTYCYFATVDENWNSAYPYAVGPTFYGVVNVSKVTSVTEQVVTYTAQQTSVEEQLKIGELLSVYPNPSTDIIAIQLKSIAQENYTIELVNMSGEVEESTTLPQGATVAFV